MNLGAEPIAAGERRPGPVDTEDVFRHRWPADAPEGTWPAWAARWRIGGEVTL